jgi:dsDNA-specific endonuclease/ATPase MutS2
MKVSDLLKKLFAPHPESGDAGAAAEQVAAEDDEDVDPFNPFTEPVRLEITDVFDLHSIPPRDVKRVVEEYLREARRLGFPAVRIIHGKGVGAQRETVRGVLARTPFVEHFADAPPEAGGWGATIVYLAAGGAKEIER